MTRQPAATVTDDTLRRNILVSGALHFVGLLFLYFGLPIFLKPLPTPTMPVPLAIVDISELTNTRVKEPEEAPKPPEPQSKPEPQKSVVQPQQQPAPPQPPSPPQPQQEQKAEQAEALIPMPKPDKKPPPPTVKPAAKPQQDMLASVLKNVEKLKPAEKLKAPDPKAQTKTKAEAQPKSMAPSLSDHLTISEEDALRRQIEQCWNPPIGARNAQTLVVQVMITVNPDRTVQNAEIVDKSRATSDPYFRSAAEAAIRALFNPRCSPLLLPEGKYEQWKRIDFNFDPREML